MVSQSPTVTGGNGSREAWEPGYSSVWCPRAPLLPVVMVPERLGGQAIHQYGVPEPHCYWFSLFADKRVADKVSALCDSD